MPHRWHNVDLAPDAPATFVAMAESLGFPADFEKLENKEVAVHEFFGPAEADEAVCTGTPRSADTVHWS